jgi:hypothetical protein
VLGWVVLVVLATLEGYGCSLPPCGIRTGGVGAGMGDALLEAVSPFDRRSLQLSWSGGSMVVRVDAVGGPPQRDFTDKGALNGRPLDVHAGSSNAGAPGGIRTPKLLIRRSKRGVQDRPEGYVSRSNRRFGSAQGRSQDGRVAVSVAVNGGPADIGVTTGLSGL